MQPYLRAHAGVYLAQDLTQELQCEQCNEALIYTQATSTLQIICQKAHCAGVLCMCLQAQNASNIGDKVLSSAGSSCSARMQYAAL
jgi:hypothetical protein